MAAPTVVLGLGATGRSVSRSLVRHGHDVIVVDDSLTDEKQAFATEHGLELRGTLDSQGWRVLLTEAEAFVPSPGVPDSHPAIAAAALIDLAVQSEFDLAARWDDRDVVAITGTDGKTTVTTMTVDMLNASGRKTIDVGNTDTPLVEAIGDSTYDLFVVEASSFRLGYSNHFAPKVGTWLNLSPDHLDKHSSPAAYEAAKASIWAHLPPDGLAVANAESEVVMRHVRSDRPAETFGLHTGTHKVLDGALTLHGEHLLHVDELWRTMPHDQTNALAAAATALAGGATIEGIQSALLAFRGLPHRVELVGSGDGVRWYNDSKATTTHAVNAAIRGFESVVLIAGGRNKGLDLNSLRDHVDRVAAVVAIGEAAQEIAATFSEHVPVVIAASMHSAVAEAASMANSAPSGTHVLLSPACASFDMYSGYAERGRDFTAEVQALLSSDQTMQGKTDVD